MCHTHLTQDYLFNPLVVADVKTCATVHVINRGYDIYLSFHQGYESIHHIIPYMNENYTEYHQYVAYYVKKNFLNNSTIRQ